MSSHEREAAETPQAGGARGPEPSPGPSGHPLPEGEGRGPPVATRFRPGQSGNPRGRPRRKRHLGAVVARALGEKIAVEDEGGRVRRLSKLEATVRAIVDGGTKGDARAIRLLFALIKADERALTEAEGAGGQRPMSEADAIVIAELRRRLGASHSSLSPHPQPLSQGERGDHPSPPASPDPLPRAGEGRAG